MVGDYYRQKAEFSDGIALQQCNTDALNNYIEAYFQAQKDLGGCNPIRIRLALNLCEFYYDVMKNFNQAQQIGDQALLDALHQIDHIDEKTFKEVQPIIEQLKDKINLWKQANS